MHRPDPRTTQAHWNQMAGDYDAAKLRNRVYYDALKACLHQAMPIGARGRVLEVGCGTGQILASLHPLNGVGIDLSPSMIEVAKRQFADRRELTFAVMDAAAAGGLGKLAGFDAVISADVLEHVADWRAVVNAMANASKFGGLIVITTPNPLWTFPLWMLEKLKLKMPEGPHRFVTASEIATHLTGRGCAVRPLTTHAMVPLRMRGIGPAISEWAERVPLLRSSGVIQLIVARKSPYA